MAAAADVGGSPTQKSILQTKQMGGRTFDAFMQRAEIELYDIQSDPDELKNLAADPSKKKTVDELKAQLIEWMRDTKDPWLRGRVSGPSSGGE